jgi:hypothetical protein
VTDAIQRRDLRGRDRDERGFCHPHLQVCATPNPIEAAELFDVEVDDLKGV